MKYYAFVRYAVEIEVPVDADSFEDAVKAAKEVTFNKAFTKQRKVRDIHDFCQPDVTGVFRDPEVEII